MIRPWNFPQRRLRSQRMYRQRVSQRNVAVGRAVNKQHGNMRRSHGILRRNLLHVDLYFHRARKNATSTTGRSAVRPTHGPSPKGWPMRS